MANYINHISQDDLDIINGGRKKRGSDNIMGFFEDLLFGLAHLTFYPLVYMALVVDMTELIDMTGDYLIIPGLGANPLIDVLSWVAMLTTGFLVIWMRIGGGISGKEPGGLAHFGFKVFMVIYCITIPVVMGMGVWIFFLIALGKFFEALPVMFPMILFVGFTWAYIQGN